ncbi:hypothetical protein AMECASPLE_038938, partial [Ameca splendens]
IKYSKGEQEKNSSVQKIKQFACLKEMIILPVPLPSVNQLKTNMTEENLKKFRHNWSPCLVSADSADRNLFILRIFCQLFVLLLSVDVDAHQVFTFKVSIIFTLTSLTPKLHAFLNTIRVFG